MMPGKINNSPQQMQIRSRHRMQAEILSHWFFLKPANRRWSPLS